MFYKLILFCASFSEGNKINILFKSSCLISCILDEDLLRCGAADF